MLCEILEIVFYQFNQYVTITLFIDSNIIQCFLQSRETCDYMKMFIFVQSISMTAKNVFFHKNNFYYYLDNS